MVSVSTARAAAGAFASNSAGQSAQVVQPPSGVRVKPEPSGNAEPIRSTPHPAEPPVATAQASWMAPSASRAEARIPAFGSRLLCRPCGTLSR